MKIDKEDMKNKLTFVVVLAVFIYILIASGASNDLLAQRYEKVMPDIINMFQVNTANIGVKNSNAIKTSSGTVNALVLAIPKNIQDLAKDDRDWSYMFQSNKKTVFYTVPDTGGDKTQIKPFIMNNLTYSYEDISQSEAQFESNVSNVETQTQLCKSIDDCNQMRKRAYNHSQLTLFFQNCAKAGACIFNATSGRYVSIRSNKAADIIEVLKKYQNW